MKIFKRLVIAISMITAISSCKKATNNNPPLASINVVHATVAVPTVKVNYFGTAINYAAFTSGPGALGYGTNTVVTVSPGNNQITVVPSADTLHPIYNAAVTTEARNVYSLYLAGQSTAPEAVFIKDIIPYYNTAGHGTNDSVFGVRVINLSYNSPPVNVTLSTSTTTNEFAGVAYKSITDFKNYSAGVANTIYTFEVRDAANPDTVMASYQFTGTSTAAVARFKNCTLALVGQIGGTGTEAPKLIRINNY